MSVFQEELSPYARKPWLSNYPAQVSPSLDYPETPVTYLLAQAARDFPGNTATIFFGSKLTYAELWQEVRAFAAFLAEKGIQKGERVAIMLPNCPQAVIAYYGALLIGAVVVPHNPLYVERELEFQLNDSGCRTIVVLDLLYPKVKNIQANTGLQNVIITRLQEYMPFPQNLLYPLKMRLEGKKAAISPAPGVYNWEDIIKDSADSPPAVMVKPDDLALIQYTGGTTGVPKGAMLTHRNLVANALQVKTWMLDGQPGQEKMLCALPFFHVYGMSVALNLGIALAAELIILPKFQIKMALDAIDQYQPTFFPGAPTMYVAINTYPKLAKYNLSSIRSCISGSAPLPVEVQETFERLTKGRLVEGYGLTEASPVTHSNPLVDSLRRIGTIGLPLPDTECKIVDPQTGAELPPGEVGELAVKGPQVMIGYWNRPEATASVLRNGWLLTGDIARMDDGGYFSIIDRKKDIVIAGGFNIYPREVEEVLYQHPAIQEVAVAGIPDYYRGETVKAYIVLKRGQELSTEEVIRYCRSKLAAYKIPRQVEFRDDLPKTFVGKILKRQLQEEEKRKGQE